MMTIHIQNQVMITQTLMIIMGMSKLLQNVLVNASVIVKLYQNMFYSPEVVVWLEWERLVETIAKNRLLKLVNVSVTLPKNKLPY